MLVRTQVSRVIGVVRSTSGALLGKLRRAFASHNSSGYNRVMNNDSIRKLTSCIDLLDLYEKPLLESLHAGSQLDQPPAVMLTRAYTFGRTTIRSMVTLAKEPDVDYSVCAPTLCRPYYELAMRILWASRTNDGWQRLQADCANEDKRWAKRAVEIPAWKKHAQRVLDHAESVLGPV